MSKSKKENIKKRESRMDEEGRVIRKRKKKRKKKKIVNEREY